MRSSHSRFATTIMVGLLVAAACTVGGAPSSSPTTVASSAPTSLSTPTPAPAPTHLPTLTPVPSSTPDPFADQILAGEVEAECGPGGPVLVSRRVEASSQGVRFVVVGPVGWGLNVSSDGGGEGVWLESDSADETLLIPPGDVAVSCADPTGRDAVLVTPLRIEDPDGLYRTVDIGATAGGCVAGSNSYGEGALGEQGEPAELATAHVNGLAPGDVVERGGYPVQTGLVRIVRAGEVIGWIAFSPDGHGGWLSSSWTLCEGLAGP